MSCAIAAVDPVAVAVEHVNVDEMRVRIDRAVGPDASRAADARGRPGGRSARPRSRWNRRFPGSADGPRPGFAPRPRRRYFCPGLQRRNLGPQRTQELAFDHASLAEREDVDADLLILEELGLRLGGLRRLPRTWAEPYWHPGKGGCGSAARPCRRSPWPRSRSRPAGPCGTRCSLTSPPADNRSSAPHGRKRPRAGSCCNGPAPARSLCNG